jgi:hypothetical protein
MTAMLAQLILATNQQDAKTWLFNVTTTMHAPKILVILILAAYTLQSIVMTTMHVLLIPV